VNDKRNENQTALRLTVSERIPTPGRRLQGLVDQILRRGLPEAIRCIQEGRVTVNGRVIRKPHVQLQPGDTIEATYQPKPVRVATIKSPLAQRVPIVFEDDAIVVVNKPAGLLTVPTPKQESHTVLSMLSKSVAVSAPSAQVCCVHRLDRGVSGLLVFAKSVPIAEQLRNQFADRKPQRRYLAIVNGQPDPAEGMIRSYLATDKQLNRFSTDDDTGELAITHYQTLQSVDGASLVEVHLETGRRNQIRVHMAELGYPVLGDARYGRHHAPHRRWPHQRLALHAIELGFNHPITQKPLHFRTKLPREFHSFAW
jgi:23S rRNA pseudouridine1911/1915/1917 synthase